MDKIYKEVIVFILNDNNEILFLKRSKEESHNYNKWAPLAGHIEDFDKTIEDAAIREIKEELGISIDKENLTNITPINEYLTTCFFYIKLNTNNFTLQKEEVSKVKWYDINEVIDKIEKEDNDIVSSKKILELLKTIKVSDFND